MKKTVIGILSALFGAAAGAKTVEMRMKQKIAEKKSMSDKHFQLFIMMNQWVRVKQKGKNLSDYLERKGIHRIAIYGMHYAGETLVEELRHSNIEIAYGIDRRTNALFADFPIISVEDPLDDVDAIIVTPITFFDEIEQELSQKIDCRIISLEDILYEI